MRPGKVPQTEEKWSHINELIHGRVDGAGARNRPFDSRIDGILLCPIHADHAEKSKYWNDGLKGHKEAGEEEQIHKINVFIAYLELYVFIKGVQIGLVET